MRRLLAALTLSAALVCTTLPALAGVCMPRFSASTGMPVVASNENSKGCWIGWYCPDKSGAKYIAAAPKNACSLVGTRRAVYAWLKNPSAESLKFGNDPFTDPTLLAVWQPDAAMLEATR